MQIGQLNQQLLAIIPSKWDKFIAENSKKEPFKYYFGDQLEDSLFTQKHEDVII